ncbi:MAG TPA: hypothetical protein VLV86_06440 [Vicinamibacterales bacterium]|nr:hypothetical protein [Vicinamibacterales bacterium]
MNQMDDELRRTLRRVEAPDGFAARVRERIARDAARTVDVQPSRFLAPLRLAIAATLVAAIAGGVWYRAETQRRVEQGEEARRQVLLSLSIAGSKLHAVEMKVNHAQER